MPPCNRSEDGQCRAGRGRAALGACTGVRMSAAAVLRSRGSAVEIASLRKWDKDTVVFRDAGPNAHLSALVVMEAFLGAV